VLKKKGEKTTVAKKGFDSENNRGEAKNVTVSPQNHETRHPQQERNVKKSTSLTEKRGVGQRILGGAGGRHFLARR